MVHDTSKAGTMTVSSIAEALGVAARRVDYVTRTRPHIRPAGWAGNARLYSAESMAMIRHELNGIDARKGGRR